MGLWQQQRRRRRRLLRCRGGSGLRGPSSALLLQPAIPFIQVCLWGCSSASLQHGAQGLLQVHGHLLAPVQGPGKGLTHLAHCCARVEGGRRGGGRRRCCSQARRELGLMPQHARADGCSLALHCFIGRLCGRWAGARQGQGRCHWRLLRPATSATQTSLDRRCALLRAALRARQQCAQVQQPRVQVLLLLQLLDLKQITQRIPEWGRGHSPPIGVEELLAGSSS